MTSDHSSKAHLNGDIYPVITGCSKVGLSQEGSGQKGTWESPSLPGRIVQSHRFGHLDSWSTWTMSSPPRSGHLPPGQSLLGLASTGGRASGQSPCSFLGLSCSLCRLKSPSGPPDHSSNVTLNQASIRPMEKE